MKYKILSFLLCITLLTGIFAFPSDASTEWPSGVSIEADAGIVMDARSGAVLFGKNIHSTYSPASITKVLTASIVLEHCSLDEIVTFSANAVYNVEENSSSAGYDVGDQASVKDCLYALLLKSANESANALAEHVAGSTEAFAEMMNEKAAELGCMDSHFTNPSGLNDEEHYVSAYDMALITRHAFENETFSEISATPYYKLPPNKRNPEGQGISPGNKMIKKNWPDQYRPDVIGGKTGFTSIALNTLVICAEQENTKLVTVVLHSQATQYDDTKRLLDFGFGNFRSVKISDYDTAYSNIGADLEISGLPTSEKATLKMDPDSTVILPKTADFHETAAHINYELPENAPKDAVARIQYTLEDRPIGEAYLLLSKPSPKETAQLPAALLDVQPSSIPFSEETEHQADGFESEEESDGKSRVKADAKEPEENSNLLRAGRSAPAPQKQTRTIPTPVLIAAASVLFIIVLCLLWIRQSRLRKKKEEEDRLIRRKRRLERLEESGVSEEDFNLMMQQKRMSRSLDLSDELKKQEKHF